MGVGVLRTSRVWRERARCTADAKVLAADVVAATTVGGDRSDVATEWAAVAREIGILKELRHEHIVVYLETQRTADELCIVMEYVRGGSITELLKLRGGVGLPTARALRYMEHLLEGLAYLHSQQVIHRDLKGANLLIASRRPAADSSASTSAADVSEEALDDTLKIADFGAARLLQQDVTLKDEVRSLQGTPFWMAPEVITGESYGRKADVWSAGCVLIEMLQGAPPWAAQMAGGANLYAVMWHIASCATPPPMPEAPLVVRQLMLTCFDREANARPSAHELLAQFPLNLETAPG